MHATRAAVEEGIVAGGGVALVRAASALDDVSLDDETEQVGVDIVRRALEEPLRQIAHNAGQEDSVILAKVRDEADSVGYDALKDEFNDMFSAGVIDPTKVVRVALQNASQYCWGLMITTEALVADIPEKEPPMPAGPPGGEMGGMY